MSKEHDLKKRIEDLEMKVAFQDDTIEALNKALAQQELELMKLWDANRLLKQGLNEMKANDDIEAPEPPPPHY